MSARGARVYRRIGLLTSMHAPKRQCRGVV